MSEILKNAGVNSGSLYYLFRTKEDLLLAVLEKYTTLLHAAVIDPAFTRQTDPIGRIFEVMSGYRQMLILTDCRQGCPIGNLALEMSERSEAVRLKIAENFDGWRKAIRGCLIDAADRLPAGIDRDKLATFILTVMEGGVMQARAHRSIEPFDACITILHDFFDRLQAAAAGGIAGAHAAVQTLTAEPAARAEFPSQPKPRKLEERKHGIAMGED